MKNLKRILSFFIVMGFMFVMFGFRVGVKATDTTVTYTVTSTSTVTSDVGSAPAATYSQTHGTKFQATGGNSLTLTVPFSVGVIIKSVTMSMRSNKSAGKGTLDISLGGKTIYAISSATQFNDSKWYGNWSTSYVDVVKELNVTTNSNCDLVIHIAATENSLYCQSYKIVYEEITEPFIGVSGESSLMVGGNTGSLTATSKNILPAPASYTWASSDTGVATVSSSGVVTPVAMGTTNITASASGATSANFQIKVYPSNASPINIATAVQIASFAGDTLSPYKYKSSGTVTATSNDGRSYTLTDESGSITVYKYNHGKELNDVVTLQGDLTNYDNETIEYTNIAYCYDVTFNTDGGSGSFGPYNNVVSGSKISNPGTPTKAGNTFTGWFNGLTKWNFENDTVTGPLTLTAKWASDAAQTAINNALESANAYMSLAYAYTLNKIDTPASYTKVTSISHLTDGDSVIVVFTKQSDPTSTIALNSSITSNKTTGTVVTISNDTVTSGIDDSCCWELVRNNDGTWKLKNGTNYLKISTDSGYSMDTTGSNLDLHITNTDSYFTITHNDKFRTLLFRDNYDIRNYASTNIGGTGYSHVNLYVKQATAKYSFRDVDFRIRCAFDDSLSILNEDYAVAFGIEITAGGNTVRYGSNNGATFQIGGGKCYVTLDLGDMLNTNYANLDTEFTVRAYVEYQGAYFYSTNTKTYSVKGMVDYYYNNQHINAVSGLKEILENYGYTFE